MFGSGSNRVREVLNRTLATLAGVDFLRFKPSGAGVPEIDLELLQEAAEAAEAPLRVVAGITVL